MSVEKIIELAKSEVGYLEKASNSDLYSKTGNAGRNNYTKYAKELYDAGFFNGNKNGYEWCTSFVTWLFYKVYGKTVALDMLCQTGTLGAGCYYAVQYFKAQNRYSYTPQVGDQIFFSDSDGDPCHTGIVYAIDTTYVYTIEGNTSGASGVVSNGGGVAKKQYRLDYSRIHGYGHPKWDVGNTATYKTGWNQNDTGWWYVHENGSYTTNGWEKINDKWYYFDEKGYMYENKWLKYKGQWYYLGENGYMYASKWLKYNDKWYYFDANGYMVTNEWIQYNGDYYFMEGDGVMATNKTVIIGEDGKITASGEFYHTFGELPSGYKKELQKLVDAGKLRGKEGTGDDMVLDMSEDAVRVLIVLNR